MSCTGQAQELQPWALGICTLTRSASEGLQMSDAEDPRSRVGLLYPKKLTKKSGGRGWRSGYTTNLRGTAADKCRRESFDPNRLRRRRRDYRSVAARRWAPN